MMIKGKKNQKMNENHNHYEKRRIQILLMIQQLFLRILYELHGKIMNLDGIVSYTYAYATIPNDDVFLIHPGTSEPHAGFTLFRHSETWNYTDLKSVSFLKPIMIWRGISVGMKACIQSCFCF